MWQKKVILIFKAFFKTKTKFTALKGYCLPDCGRLKAAGDTQQFTWTGYFNINLFFVQVYQADFRNQYTFPCTLCSGTYYHGNCLLFGLLLASACAAEQFIYSPEFLFVICKGLIILVQGI